MKTAIEQKIISHFPYLNPFQLSELLDFAEFIRYKKGNVFASPEAVDALCGKYKKLLTPSKQFAERKQEEIRMEEEKWKRG